MDQNFILDDGTVGKNENLISVKKMNNEEDILHSDKTEEHILCGLIPKENISTYLLLIAISIHSIFEGIALGLLSDNVEIFYMLIAVASHKWVEALSIGISLHKSDVDYSQFKNLINIFSLTTPIGVLLGLIFSGLSLLIEATFLAISAGITIYF
jgi:zinc transporter 1/2/3